MYKGLIPSSIVTNLSQLKRGTNWKFWLKIAQLRVKNANFATFWRHEKVGQRQNKWDMSTVGYLATIRGTVPPK